MKTPIPAAEGIAMRKLVLKPPIDDYGYDFPGLLIDLLYSWGYEIDNVTADSLTNRLAADMLGELFHNDAMEADVRVKITKHFLDPDAAE